MILDNIKMTANLELLVHIWPIVNKVETRVGQRLFDSGKITAVLER